MAHRKLQQEVDKVFKKITEGVESFEIYYERHELSSNQTQRDKLENDMKKEIKKLQRLREQIKVWQSTNDVKDKDKLLKFRKLVESEMEKYKQVEKFSKQKAYSKEVLNQPEKLSPQDQFRLSTIQYIQSILEKLQIQQESIEADISKIGGSGANSNTGSSSKKRKNHHHNNNSHLSFKDQERRQELIDSIERVHFHQKNLELILRQLENNDLTLNTDQFTNLKDDIEYFLEMNLEPDFMFDDSIYEFLDLKIANEDDNSSSTIIAVNNNENILPPLSSQNDNISKESSNMKSSPKKPSNINNTPSNNSQQENEIVQQVSKNLPRENEKLQHEHEDSELSEEQQQKSWASFTANLHNNNSNSPPSSAPVSYSSINNENGAGAAVTNNSNNISVGTMVDNENDTIFKNNIMDSAPGTAVSYSSSNNEELLSKLKSNYDFSNIGYLARFDKPLIYSSSKLSGDEKKNYNDNNSHLTNAEIQLMEDCSMVSIPSGIQMFIDSYVQSNNSSSLKDDVKYKSARDMLLNSRHFSILNSSSSIPIQSSEFQKLNSLWDLTRTASLYDETQFLKLDPMTLFFGFYFGLSQAERRLAMSLLYLKNWRLKNDQINWFLKVDKTKNNKNDSENAEISNFEVFNALNWTASIVYNYKLDLNSLIKI